MTLSTLPPDQLPCYDGEVHISPAVLRIAPLVAMLAAACSRERAPVTTADGGRAVVQLLQEPFDVEPFTVTDLDGRTISSADLKGKVVLVNFWATWCPPCRSEIPDLIELQAKYRDKLVVLGISEDEAPIDEVKAFVADQKMNYPVAMVTPDVQRIFKGVSALPTTFVIDPDGKVQQRHTGLLNPATTELETQVLAGLRTDVTIERVEDEKKALLANAAQAKEIPGVDLSSMTPEQRTAALKALNAEDCTCGCGLTLAACRINDPECSVSLPIAQKIATQIASGER
ncbi:MAG: TlpA family protein disulfide reductase [Acidimicrobiia bacterium]|nr:TlpA family protein disulfide reductase [Acidimicrobiia bacterium]